MRILPAWSALAIAAAAGALVGGTGSLLWQRGEVHRLELAGARLETQVETLKVDAARAQRDQANAELGAQNIADVTRKQVENETAERLAGLTADNDRLRAARAAADERMRQQARAAATACPAAAGPAAAGEGSAAADGPRGAPDRGLLDDLGDEAARHADEYGVLLVACRDNDARIRAELGHQGFIVKP